MIEEIHKSFAEVYDKGYVNGYKDAKKKFDRPHGEWKADGTCSECGVYSSLNKDTAYFCPNCGADMRGEGEKE